jgi:hypothetical protein
MHVFWNQVEQATEFDMCSLFVFRERERMLLLLATSCFEIPCSSREFPHPKEFYFWPGRYLDYMGYNTTCPCNA